MEGLLNILVTSAGRRTSLIAAFQNAAHPFGQKVLVADFDPLAPACALADGAFMVPRVSDPGYLPALRAIAREQEVGLIVPTIDPELAALSRQVETFRRDGVSVLVSAPEFVAVCRDKWMTSRFFKAEGIDVPASWLPDTAMAALPEEIFLKPRDGSASSNICRCRREDLQRVLPSVPNALIQECLYGVEITIDSFLDFQSRPIHYVPRERIRTLGGESIQGVTLDRPELDPWLVQVLQACSRLGARGPLTLQAFLTERGPVLTEVNPRFGGGFPLGLAAGGDYPAWILALLRGETLEPRLGQYRRGLYMSRYYREIFTETLPWPR
ncbi:MAG: ATP-grasp domain-containing protein [Holophaga sp.]|nr:ATP-grasp domain-containing protein [Holophaga sp.]